MPARSLPWLLAVGAALLLSASAWAEASADDKPTADAKPPQPRKDLLGDPLPAGAVARLGAARLCQQAVNYLAFSPDDKAVAALDNGSLRLWDVQTGRELRHFDVPLPGLSPATANVPLAFSADGKLVAGICGGVRIRVWNAATGRERLKADDALVPSDLAMDPKGRFLATGGNGGPILLWDLENEKLHAACDINYPLNWMTFSADGTRLIAAAVAPQVSPGTPTEKILHFNVSDGKLIREFSRPLDGTYRGAPSSDGALFAAPTKDGTALRLLNTSDGKEIRKTAGRADAPFEVRFSGDGRFLTASSGDGTVRVWGVADGKVAHEFKGLSGGVKQVALSHGGKLLALAGPADDAIHIWDLETSKELHSFGGHRAGSLSVVFSRDGKSVFTTNKDGLYKGAIGPAADWSLREWDPATGKERRVVKDDLKEQVYFADFSRDGRLLSLVTREGKLRLWDTAAGRELLRRPVPVAVLGMTMKEGQPTELSGPDVHEPQFSADGRVLYAGGNRDAVIHRWDTATGKELPSLNTPNGYYPSIPQAASDGKTLLVTETGQAGFHMTLADAETGRVVRGLWEGHGRRVAWDLSPDGRTLAASDGAGTTLLEVAGGRDRGKLGDGTDQVMNLTYSPDGKLLAVVGENEVRLWRPATGDLVCRLEGCCGQADCLAFSPDGKRLAVGENRNTVLIFDVDALGAPAAAPPALTDKETGDTWADLSADDAAKAYRALGRLASDPDRTVAFVKAHWKPASELDAPRVARLLAELDDDDFDVREKAAEELRRHSPATDEAMRRALRDTPSAEVQYRIRQALRGVPTTLSPPPSAELVDLRVMELLELCGTEAAERLLKELDRGPADALPTREAHAALGRLASRAASPP